MAKEQVALRRLNSILQKWPENPSMKGRDLGEFLAKSYRSNMELGKISNVDQELDCLEKLAGNYYRKRYRREKDYSYCEDLAKFNYLSNENIEKTKKKSIWQRFSAWFMG